MNSCCSQTHGLGKAMATEVVVAFGPSNVYCDLSLWGPMWQWSLVRINLSGVFFKGEPPVQSNLKGCWVNTFTHGDRGPLAFTWQSITTWAIAH